VPSAARVSATQSPERPATQSPERPAYPFHDPKKEEESGNRFLPFNWTTATNPYAAADAHDVFWKPDGTIEVLNGFKVELEKNFPNVDIASGLAIVAGETKSGAVVGTDLKQRIRRKFGYLNNDEKGKDRRAQTPRKPAKPANPWSTANR
jgi:hypothetical protein